MATTTTGNLGTNALGILADRKVIETFQPELFYEQLAEVRVVGEGNFTDRFFLFDQIATSSVSTLTEGTAPAGLAATITSKDVTPTQYGLFIELTDLVVATSAISLIEATAMEVGKAMARKIDQVIQVTANAGTNVIYGGAAANRAALVAGDKMTYTLAVRSTNKLRNQSAPTFEGGTYRAVLSINQAYDLKADTALGMWTDVSKYANPDRLLNGEIGMVDGTRIVASGNVSTFASTITVHPALFAGNKGLRVSYWLPSKVKSYINAPESSINNINPLGQKGTVGAKTNIGVARVREEALVRAETSGTAL